MSGAPFETLTVARELAGRLRPGGVVWVAERSYLVRPGGVVEAGAASASAVRSAWRRGCAELLTVDRPLEGAAVYVAAGVPRAVLAEAGLARYLDDEGVLAVPAWAVLELPWALRVDAWAHGTGWVFGYSASTNEAYAERAGALRVSSPGGLA